MKSPVAKKVAMLGLAALFCFSISFTSVGFVAAANCPSGDFTCTHAYLKGLGSDVGTGGWFNSGINGCLSSGSLFQDSNFSPSGGSGNPLYGGILGFAKSSGINSAGGSSSEFAALTLGIVEGPSAQVPNSGFYSAGLMAKAADSAGKPNTVPISYTTFANASSPVSNAPWGGLLVPQGKPRQASFCVPDYYNTKIPTSGCSSLPSDPLSPKLSGSLPKSAYCEDVGSGVDNIVPNSAYTLPVGKKLTVFVKGNVYIGHEIRYAGGTADNTTKFALVVQGSIYIDPSVRILNGLYIAQPDPAAGAGQVANDTGIIWTCHPSTATLPSDAYTSFFPRCDQQLFIYGALIAKRIAVMRIFGVDVDDPSVNVGEDSFPRALFNTGAAEVINFSPDMVVGGPFFTNDTSGSGNPKIDSLISLPPVF